jgi:hypothetical protein
LGLLWQRLGKVIIAQVKLTFQVAPNAGQADASAHMVNVRGDGRVNGFHDDVKVVIQEAVGVAHPVEVLADLPKEIEPLLPTRIVQANSLASVTP